MEKLNEFEYQIKKSRFIGILYSINNIEEVNLILKNLKNNHKSAKHICYGYIMFKEAVFVTKTFNDNEPKGTASLPILKTLQSNKLNNHVLFIVRYFGGTLLGSSNLYRAYLKTANETIKSYLNRI